MRAAIASSCSACLGVAQNICLWFSRQISSTLSCRSVCRGVQNSVLRRWSRCLLGWPRGSPVAAVHLESGWPDAQRLITGRLLSLFGRITSMPIGDYSLLPATVSRVMASCLGSLIATCSDLCTTLEIVTPSSFGVGPGCSVKQVRAWFTQCVAPPLDRALRDRLSIAKQPSLSTTWTPPQSL